MKKIIKKIYYRFMRKKGYSKYASDWIIKDLIKDLKRKDIKLSQKIWCWKRGFNVDKLGYYKLNENNYKKYLSDLEFYKLFPINNEFCRLIDDKITLKYVLHKYNKYLPQYYFLINNNSIEKIFDCEEQYGNDVKSLRRLLSDKKKLALKLLQGEKGKGFYKLEEAQGKIYVNQELYSEEEFFELINELKGYIVTEYIQGNYEIEKIYDKSLNTARVIYLNDGKEKYCYNAYIRFGNNKSGVVDNVSNGGLISFIDKDTGKFEDGFNFKCEKVLMNVKKHPDTKMRIRGTIPYWDDIKSKIIEIGEYLFPLELIGFDIAITEDSFKIIEINSFSELRSSQIIRPLKTENEKIKNYFERKLEIKNGKNNIRR